MTYLRPLFLIALLFPGPLAAQENGAGKYTIVESLDPSISDAAQEYREIADQNRIRTDVTYVTELDGQLIEGEAARPRQERPEPDTGNGSFSVPSMNGSGVVIALLIFLGAIFLWLKFGGSGALLSREPYEAKSKKTQAPDAWNIASDDLHKGPQSILDKIAAMQDRSEALVLLLRYSLLAASETTSTRFARSDTERSAFSRLPEHWAHISGLEAILRQAELAHYGGRDVTDDNFSAAIELGRNILGTMNQRQINGGVNG